MGAQSVQWLQSQSPAFLLFKTSFENPWSHSVFAFQNYFTFKLSYLSKQYQSVLRNQKKKKTTDFQVKGNKTEKISQIKNIKLRNILCLT